MSVEDHAPDWLRALHAEEAFAPPHPGVEANLRGMLEGWARWPASMDFVDPDSPNAPWKGLMTELYARRIRHHLGALPGGRILDLACGSGRGGALTAEDATRSGIDATLPSLRAARRHLPQDRLLWADVQELDRLAPALAGPFDGALAMELLCYLPDPAALLSALRPLLREGAPLVLSVEAWPGAVLTDPGPAEALADALRDRVLFEPGVRWVHPFEAEELAGLLDAAGFQPLVIEGTHYVLEGPLRALTAPDPPPERAALLSLEDALRADASLPPRAWLALARARR